MKLLMHVCCAPCTAYPLTLLREEGLNPRGFFHNPNIHPFKEFKKRLQALDEFSRRMDFPVEAIREYGLKEYLRKVVFSEDIRCGLCYEMRLRSTVIHAREIGADAFTTTLLYSKYQQHEKICEIAGKLAEEFGVPFYYRDFRPGWQKGIDLSREMGLYRQPYCGCIYSEQERYDKSLRKKKP
ncbi:epoxyqueuosine reductase QueH [Thermodesulfobacteriota bacterium]